MEFIRRQDESIPHSPIGMHTERLERSAAVRLSVPARNTLTAIQVALDGTTVSRLDISHPLSDSLHLNAQFVTKYPGVRKKRHRSLEGMHVRAANADPVHPHERLARSGFSRRRRIGHFQHTRLQQGYGTHTA